MVNSKTILITGSKGQLGNSLKKFQKLTIIILFSLIKVI